MILLMPRKSWGEEWFIVFWQVTMIIINIMIIIVHYIVDAEKEEEDNHYDFVDAEKELRWGLVMSGGLRAGETTAPVLRQSEKSFLKMFWKSSSQYFENHHHNIYVVLITMFGKSSAQCVENHSQNALEIPITNPHFVFFRVCHLFKVFFVKKTILVL